MATKNVKFKEARKAVICLLVISIIISGALAYLSSQTGTWHNLFSLGSMNTKLIETFNGRTYDGGYGEISEVTLEPGRVYEKTAKVKFTGRGNAFAYIKVGVPTVKSSDIVTDNGMATDDELNIVTLNTQNIGNGANQWTKITEEEIDGIKYIVYGYNSRLSNKEIDTTETSALKSVSIANVLLNESSTKLNYDIPVLAYTLQSIKDTDTPQSIWAESKLEPVIH